MRRAYLFQISVLCFCLFFTQIAGAFSLKDFERIKHREPPLNRIIQVYFKNEGLTNAHFQKWRKQIKSSAYLPTLYVGYDHALKEAQGVSVTDNVSISSGIVTVGPEDNDYDYDSNLGHTIRVRAVWKLDQVVFNNKFLSLSREKRDLAKLRFELGQKITKIYEQRSLALIKYLQMRGASRKKAGLFYAQYEVLTESLDAMTGGEFKGKWWRRK